MLILRGPAKVDLIFYQPHPVAPPWRVTATTLPLIDDHFWDWVLWLGSEQLAGKDSVVRTELRKLHAPAGSNGRGMGAAWPRPGGRRLEFGRPSCRKSRRIRSSTRDAARATTDITIHAGEQRSEQRAVEVP